MNAAMEAGQVPRFTYNNPPTTATPQQVQYEKNRDWSDWILFGFGWIFGITWIVGALRPLCRHPKFPAPRNKAGWIANVVGTLALIAIIIAAAVVVSKHHKESDDQRLSRPTVDATICKTVSENSGDDASCAGNLPVPACCYEDSGTCLTYADAAAAVTCYGSLPGCCPA